MKAILEFKLPKQTEDFEAAYLGHAYKELVKEYLQWLKWEIKTTEDSNVAMILESARDEIYQKMKDFKITIG